MHRFNIAIVAGLLAVAAAVGTIAATRTVSLGASQQHASATTLQARTRQLDAFERSLRRALARRPPKLPAVPQLPASARTGPAAPLVSSAATQAPPVQTVYRRPPPVVVIQHVHHGDDGGYDAEGGSGGGDD
jgi:hypothetical protein